MTWVDLLWTTSIDLFSVSYTPTMIGYRIMILLWSYYDNTTIYSPLIVNGYKSQK